MASLGHNGLTHNHGYKSWLRTLFLERVILNHVCSHIHNDVIMSWFQTVKLIKVDISLHNHDLNRLYAYTWTHYYSYNALIVCS